MTWRLFALGLTASLLGCEIEEPKETDADGDGFVEADDCDDADAAVNPDAAEVCDGVDNNCDGSIDNDAGDASTFYADADGDGYGDAAATEAACEASSGYVDNSDDCDDADAAVNPDTVWYLDADSDTFGDGVNNLVQCEQPGGYVIDGTDCDDADATTYPGAAEACDDLDHNCDGLIDNDADADGYSDQACGGSDCDDTSVDYSPAAAEGCDGTDRNCDGLIDNDLDGDTFSDEACGGLDCDDTDSNLYPDSTGYCGYYESCLGIVDAGLDAGDGTYTIDPDGMDYGEDPIQVYCDMKNGGWTLCGALSRGYVPADMLYNHDAYAFQARLNGDNNFVFETEAPGRSAKTWKSADDLNYGQFCNLMDETTVSTTLVEAKMWDYTNDYGASLKGSAYDLERSGVYEGNLYTQWFTNSSSSRTFTRVSGDQLYVRSDSNGYGGPYTTPTVAWDASGNVGMTQSTNPWGGVDSSVDCTGCTYYGSGYDAVPYDTKIINNLSHSVWKGIPDVEYGWSDCTANGQCVYHESGLGVWLFWVQ